jgi:DNA-binding FadR family transcriptional regulator
MAIIASRPPKPKLSARVIEALRADIESGKVPGGKRLPTENELAETFGVSRTVVREAVAALASDGLVEARQGAGMFAVQRKLSAIGLGATNKISIAINVLEVRIGIEMESAALAAERRNPSQDAAIHEAYDEFDRLLSADQATGKADFAFHRAIAQATGNPFYLEVLDALGARTIPCDVTSPWGTDTMLTREYQQGLQVEHARIMDAISEGDVAEAREAMRAHLTSSQQRYRARLRQPTPPKTGRG